MQLLINVIVAFVFAVIGSLLMQWVQWRVYR